MISAEQIDDEFAAHGLVGAKSKQRIVFEIGHFGCADKAEWMNNDTLCIRVGAGDQVEDIDLNIVCGRDVWIQYDYDDPLAVMKMKDLSALMRFSSLRPCVAAFLDRKNHVRALTPKSRGWEDKTPAGYDELRKENEQ